eukprot:scaffold14633_cov63-Phaeocystis_antarctica.AAC.2
MGEQLDACNGVEGAHPADHAERRVHKAEESREEHVERARRVVLVGRVEGSVRGLLSAWRRRAEDEGHHRGVPESGTRPGNRQLAF